MRTSIIILAFLASPLALAAVPEKPPAMVVVPATPAAASAAKPVSRALDARGVTVVPPPAKRPPLSPGALARAVNADATVQIGVSGTRRTGHFARLRVVAPDGQVRFDGTVPIAGTRPTADEAGALASLALQSLAPPELALVPPVPPPPVRPKVPPGPPNVAGHTTVTKPAPPPPPDEVVVPPPAGGPPAPTPDTILPPPEKLGLAGIWAAPTLSWRNQKLTTAQPRPGLDFDTSSPYVGIGLGGDWYPFGGFLHDRLGFSVNYSYSYVRLSAQGVPEGRGSEHRFQGDVVWRMPSALWGDLSARVGVAYEGFLVPSTFPMTSSTHISPRFGFDWERRLVGPVELFASAGLRPWTRLGSDLQNTFGQDSSSTGADASIGLAGPAGLPGLKWNVGYGYLRYEDRLVDSAGVRTQQVESIHRMAVGLSYERRL